MALTVITPTNREHLEIPFDVQGTCTDYHEVTVKIGSFSKTQQVVNGTFLMEVDDLGITAWDNILTVSCGDPEEKVEITGLIVSGTDFPPPS